MPADRPRDQRSRIDGALLCPEFRHFSRRWLTFRASMLSQLLRSFVRPLATEQHPLHPLPALYQRRYEITVHHSTLHPMLARTSAGWGSLQPGRGTPTLSLSPDPDPDPDPDPNSNQVGFAAAWPWDKPEPVEEDTEGNLLIPLALGAAIVVVLVIACSTKPREGKQQSRKQGRHGRQALRPTRLIGRGWPEPRTGPRHGLVLRGASARAGMPKAESTRLRRRPASHAPADEHAPRHGRGCQGRLGDEALWSPTQDPGAPTREGGCRCHAVRTAGMAVASAKAWDSFHFHKKETLGLLSGERGVHTVRVRGARRTTHDPGPPRARPPPPGGGALVNKRKKPHMP